MIVLSVILGIGVVIVGGVIAYKQLQEKEKDGAIGEARHEKVPCPPHEGPG